tara:strand:- start:8578 stop:8826 length:249 start_codon:yes stop_codon:yes gene_type:complete
MTNTLGFIGFIIGIIGLLMIFGFGSPKRDKRYTTGYKDNQIPKMSLWKRVTVGLILSIIGFSIYSNNSTIESKKEIENKETK